MSLPSARPWDPRTKRNLKYAHLFEATEKIVGRGLKKRKGKEGSSNKLQAA